MLIPKQRSLDNRLFTLPEPATTGGLDRGDVIASLWHRGRGHRIEPGAMRLLNDQTERRDPLLGVPGE